MITLNKSNLGLVKTHTLIWNSWTNELFYAPADFKQNGGTNRVITHTNTTLHTCYPNPRECRCNLRLDSYPLMPNNPVWHIVENETELTMLVLGDTSIIQTIKNPLK